MVVVRDALSDDPRELGEIRRVDEQRPVLVLEPAVKRLHLSIVVAIVQGVREPDSVAQHQVAYEDSSIYLLKRWDSSKGVDHYAVGLAGVFARRLGSSTAVIVQLPPSGISLEPWVTESDWIDSRAPGILSAP